MINTPMDPLNTQPTSTPVSAATSNSPNSPYEMKPRSLSELIALTLQVFGRHIGPFMGIALVVMGPAALISLLSSAFSGQSTQSFQQTATSTSVSSVSEGISTVIVTCTGLISLIIALHGVLSYAATLQVWTYSPDGPGTRMRWSAQVHAKGAYKLLGLLITWIGIRQEQRIWSSLKNQLEAAQ